MTNNGRKSGSLRYSWDTDASTSFLRLHNGGTPSEVPLTTSDIIQIYVSVLAVDINLLFHCMNTLTDP